MRGETNELNERNGGKMPKKKDINKLEIELYETKWFDYRPVSPDVATMMFLLDYVKSMATYNDTLGNSRYVHTLKQFQSMDLETVRQQKNFKMLRGLRQWADKRGMRYDQFWSWATEAHLKLGFAKMFINVFYNASILAEVEKAHAEWTAKFLVRSDHKYFRASAFKGYPVQLDYYDYLVKGTLQRNDSKLAARTLAQLVKAGEIDHGYLQNALKEAA
jgi:hypothetical protein